MTEYAIVKKTKGYAVVSSDERTEFLCRDKRDAERHVARLAKLATSASKVLAQINPFEGAPLLHDECHDNV